MSPSLLGIFLMQDSACAPESMGPEIEPHAVYDRLKAAFPAQCHEGTRTERWGSGYSEPKYRTTIYRCEGVSVPLDTGTVFTGFSLVDTRRHRYEHLQAGKGSTANIDTFTATYFFAGGTSLSQSRFMSLGAGVNLSSFGKEPRKVSEQLVSWGFDTGTDTAHAPASAGDAETLAAQTWAALASWAGKD